MARAFTPSAGTVFGDRKLPVRGWAELLLALMPCGSLASMARRGRRSPAAPPCQLAKPFPVLDGMQDAAKPDGRVQMDEMMYAVPASGRGPAPGGRHGGGHSGNSTCIAVAYGERDGGPPAFRVPGWGKPSAGRACAAYCPSLAEGLAPVHDRESSRNAVARKLDPASGACGSRAIGRLPDSGSPLWKADRPCFLPRLFLDAHTGFGRPGLAGWLGLFPAMANPPGDRFRKAAMALGRAMASPNTLGYRDCCLRKPSPGESPSHL
jgi:hypothetical protein